MTHPNQLPEGAQLTLKELFALIKKETNGRIVASQREGEIRVAVRGEPATAYFTNDRADALATARSMARTLDAYRKMDARIDATYQHQDAATPSFTDGQRVRVRSQLSCHRDSHGFVVGAREEYATVIGVNERVGVAMVKLDEFYRERSHVFIPDDGLREVLIEDVEPDPRPAWWEMPHDVLTLPHGSDVKALQHVTPGDRIVVKACPILGTPERMGTVMRVPADRSFLMVHIDGDEVDWFGPVDLDGNVLQESPTTRYDGEVRTTKVEPVTDAEVTDWRKTQRAIDGHPDDCEGCDICGAVRGE